MKKIIFTLFVIILLSGCQTNPPTSTPPPGSGKIFVTANVDGAEIFIDNANTGKVTPDTVETIVGTHEVRVEKDNYIPSSQTVEVIKDSVVQLSLTLVEATLGKVVLLEDFSNTSCIPCLTSNKIIESLVSDTYGHDKIVAIKFPTNFPGPGDPFYNANSADCDSRISYYNIFSAPTTIIDGTERPISTDSVSIKNSINQQLLITPKFSVNVKDSIAGTAYFITATLRVIDGSGLDFSNIVLHTVITETDIQFSSPPGANGETQFFDVMRIMLPSDAGESLDGISANEDVVFQRQTNISPAWGGTLHTVVYVQNIATKEVYQAASTF
ncbi:PEGA domain protein [bacterium BMS3Abin03]|nr:PEGA domain protein [bacterium BMS3Abin03]